MKLNLAPKIHSLVTIVKIYFENRCPGFKNSDTLKKIKVGGKGEGGEGEEKKRREKVEGVGGKMNRLGRTFSRKG